MGSTSVSCSLIPLQKSKLTPGSWPTRRTLRAPAVDLYLGARHNRNVKRQRMTAPDQSPPYSLRPADARDSPRVAACVNAAYRHYVERIGRPPSPMTADYGKVIEECRATVVEDRDRIIGVLVLAVTEEGFLLENVAVDPSHRGKGLGRILLEFAEAEARREGFESIYLYTHEKMTENQALYAKIGYVEFERRTEKGLPRVYMRKLLR